MKFIYPQGSKNKPDLGWIWTQNMYLHELKDAIGQRWYGRMVEDSPRSLQKIIDELNAIQNFASTAKTLLEYSERREISLRKQLEERRQYDKDKRKK
tara:strand:- start:92 stop:382 length:291 start_codon:yes stop_codon:yes gene_type:complete